MEELPYIPDESESEESIVEEEEEIVDEFPGITFACLEICDLCIFLMPRNTRSIAIFCMLVMINDAKKICTRKNCKTGR